MSHRDGMTDCSRETLIERLRSRLEADSFPRVTVGLIVSLAGVAAFLTSVISLRAGLDSMGLRYGAAALGGYVVFVGLMRVWIAIRRGWEPGLEPDLDPELLVDTCRSAASVGRRARESFSIDAPGNSWFDGVDLDLDAVLFVVAAVMLALAGVIALLYVVYAAPLLLAEVALDAALVSSIYRRLRREDAGTWAGTVMRRTWAPALIVIICASLAGYALQAAAPEASSIGGVIRTLLA